MKQPETTEDYKKMIRRICKEAGTYEKTDEIAINNLSEILNKRRNCEIEFIDSGSKSVVSVRGTMRKNPILQTWIDLTGAALPYLRDLGLTPAARKKIIGDTGGNSGEALANILKDL